MPLLKHAKKKLRQDKKRTLANKKVKTTYKAAVKTAKEAPTLVSISEAFSTVDKAVKNGIIHANKGGRIKSSLSKIAPAGSAGTKKTTKKAAPAKTTKKASAVKAEPKGKTASKIAKSEASGKKSTSKLAKTTKKK